MFQPAFDTTTAYQLRWDQMEFGDVLATLDAPTTGRGGWHVTVDTGTGLDSADIATGRSDPGGQRSDTGRRSDPDDRRRDTGCCGLLAGGRGDTVSRPARTAGGQGT
jgi:hypothetical protein